MCFLLLSSFTVTSTEGLTATCAAAFETGQMFDAFRSHCVQYHHSWKEVVVHDDTVSDMETDENDAKGSTEMMSAVLYNERPELITSECIGSLVTDD